MFFILLFLLLTIVSFLICGYTTWGKGYNDDYYLKWGMPILSFVLLILSIITY